MMISNAFLSILSFLPSYHVHSTVFTWSINISGRPCLCYVEGRNQKKEKMEGQKEMRWEGRLEQTEKMGDKEKRKRVIDPR